MTFWFLFLRLGKKLEVEHHDHPVALGVNVNSGLQCYTLTCILEQKSNTGLLLFTLLNSGIFKVRYGHWCFLL